MSTQSTNIETENAAKVFTREYINGILTMQDIARREMQRRGNVESRRRSQ